LKVIQVIDGLSLTEYLALEEEMVKTIDEPTFFTWIVQPTVIYGRHQSAAVEVNEAYCYAHKIAVVQRKSGGGCVYADEGNLMVSFVTPNVHSQEVFDEFLTSLSGVLRKLGYDAVTTAHNDILVNERKVSGTACYATSTGTVVHASVLYDVNLNDLQQAITPTEEKLAKHGVSSVRQRVKNLRSIIDLGPINEFRKQVETILTQTDNG